MDPVIQETEALMVNGHAWLAIVVISLWGAAGGLITYSLGKKGIPAIQAKFHQLDPEKLEHFNGWYDRWGNPLLLISMIPLVGTMIRLVAGINGIKLVVFLAWSFIALLIRNWVLFMVAHGIIQSL